MQEVSFFHYTKDETKKINQIEKFLISQDLTLAEDVEIFVVAKKDLQIVACGGIANHTLKCIAISSQYRGQGFVLSLMTELLNLAFSMNRHKLFLYSKPKNQAFFEGCGFCVIEKIDDVIFMENSHNLEKYKKELSTYKKDYEKVGCIVMNANPFTLGHYYLAKSASEKCDWLHIFVVKEDASQFSYTDRFKLVRAGLTNIKNVTIHEGSDYIISRATFPTYFLKDTGRVDSLYSALDIKIFKNHIAKALGITHRFVGEEPFCRVTADYNKQMKDILEDGKEDEVKVVEIERKCIDEQIVSASKVRDFFNKGKLEEVQKLVPKSTYNFLEEKKIHKG